MQKIELTVRVKVGLHARPAAVFVQTAARFKSNVTVSNMTTQRGPSNAKSILGVLNLAVLQDQVIEVTADGEDEADAISALREQIESNFGEAE